MCVTVWLPLKTGYYVVLLDVASMTNRLMYVVK